jgi:RNA polymerase sigma-70 factor (ECF subfamily)
MKGWDGLKETDILQKCKEGDHVAFECLYQLYVRRAFRTAYLVLHSRLDAEDAIQETFVQVWRRIDTLRNFDAFRSWFYRILLNTTYRLQKKTRRVSCVPLDLDEHDKPDLHTPLPEEDMEAKEEFEKLQAAITSLPEAHRITLVLRYYTGLMEVEIAQVVGIPVGTVKSRLYHARRTLGVLVRSDDSKGRA